MRFLGQPNVAIAAAQQPWEPQVLAQLTGAGFKVIRRCVEVAELIGLASTGQLQLVVVADNLPGLALVQADCERWGLPMLVVSTANLAEVAKLAKELISTDPLVKVSTETEFPKQPIAAVWGPLGAPGKTTIAVGLAAGLVKRKIPVTLADFDQYGAAVAQQLGILDETSGLLQALRTTNKPDQLSAALKSLFGINILTGLPRPDRWAEIKAPALKKLIEQLAEQTLILDLGFGIEDYEISLGRPNLGRNRLAITGLQAASKVLLVGAADPVGVARLCRARAELHEFDPELEPILIFNKSRKSFRFPRQELVDLVSSNGAIAAAFWIPFSPELCDQALLRHRPVELPGLTEILDFLFPTAPIALHRASGRIKAKDQSR